MSSPPRSASPAPPGSTAVVYAIALILAVCSLLYELLIAQTMTMIAGNIVVWYSLTVGIFLASMGYSAILYGARPESALHGWRRLFTIEIALTLIGALAVPALDFAHAMFLRQSALEYSETLSTLGFYGVAFVITSLVGMLSGIELPLLIHLGNYSAGERNVSNRVLGWDYIGALAAGAFFPLFLVPYVSLLLTGIMIAVLNLIVALYIGLGLLARQPGSPQRILAGTTVGVVLLTGAAFHHSIEQFFLKKYYYYDYNVRAGLSSLIDPISELDPVVRAKSPYQKIDLVHYPRPPDPIREAYSAKFVLHPSKPENFSLFLNGDHQFGSNFEELYHEWLAHVPIIASNRMPRRVLIMGGGDGLLHRELLKYDQVESITHVDIDRRLVELAKTHSILTEINENSLEDPRITTRFADAYAWIRQYDGEPFDAIYLDFPVARDYNLSRLYSREFYTFIGRALEDDGFAVMDAPWMWVFPLMDDPSTKHQWLAGSWDVLHNTLRAAGFETVVPYFSVLETDNPEARVALANSEKLEQAIGRAGGRLDSKEAQRKWIDYYLGSLWRLRTGFIMFRKDERPSPYQYHDLGVPLYVLNENRFRLAFPVRVRSGRKIDPGLVNSILRPTLPEFDLADIRHPW